MSEISEISNEKQTQIVQAAQKRMLVYGFSKVTMDEIAEDIGMKKASLYYYFPTKEDIFRAVIKNEQDEFIEAVQSMLRQSISAEEKLRQYVQQRLRHSGMLFSLSGSMNQQWISVRPTLSDLLNEFSDKNCGLVGRILEEGNQSGEFSVAAPGKTARLFLSILQGLRMRLTKTSSPQSSTQDLFKELEEQDMMLVEIVLHGIKTIPRIQ